ncbi:MAG: hypothetical protein AAGD22_18400 [Verrucomicrobiota bacterium]
MTGTISGTQLLFAAISRDTYGLGTGQHSSAVDGLAIFLLGLIFGIVATVGAIVWQQRRRNRKQPPADLDSLLDDTPSTPLPPSQSRQNQAQEPPRDPWEKSDDWWKKEK